MSSYQFTDSQVRNYHDSLTNHLNDVQALVDAQFFEGAQTILDLGCGDGKKTAWLAQQMPSSLIVGCDVSRSMVEFAQSEYPSSEYPNLQFMEKDACDLSFNEEFDRVFALRSLHWIKDQFWALRRIYAALKPGGKAFFTVLPKSFDDPLRAACRKVILSWKWLSSFLRFESVHSFHTEKEYRKMLKNMGFLIEQALQENKQVVFPNRDSLESLMKAVLTPLYHLPEDKRSEFLDDLFLELSEGGYVHANGEIHLEIGQIRLLVSKKGTLW